MPRIYSFLFCLNTNNTNGTNNANGLLCAIAPEYVPGLYSFGVNFFILELSEGSHNICLNFKDEEGIRVASVGETAVNYTKDSNSNLPDKYCGVNIAANFQNVDFKHSGMYSMDVIFDGNLLGTFEIYVKGKNESAIS